MRFLILATAIAASCLVGCSRSSGSTIPSTPPAGEGPHVTASQEASAEETPAPSGPIPSVKLQRVFPSLSFQNMTGAYQAPDGSWWVTEKRGRIQRIDSSGVLSTVLDISDRVSTQGEEEGLLGLAFAPDFATSNRFFVYYSAASPRRTILASFISDGVSSSPGSERVRLEIPQPFSNHNGGQLVFGPDGYLYVGLGDGGSARDPMGNGQNLGTLLASLLRIDVSGDSGYVVPEDNPFVQKPGARGEIWAYGLRNPWRFAFDRQTNELWLADVGQDTREEVDIITKGGNYGWAIMEGSQCLGGGTNCDRSGLRLPVFDYANAGANCSITGGFVYRGNAIAGLQGAYVFGDYCSGLIWAIRQDGNGTLEQKQIASSGFQVSSFGQGGDGELYVLQYAGSGGIFKIVP